ASPGAAAVARRRRYRCSSPATGLLAYHRDARPRPRPTSREPAGLGGPRRASAGWTRLSPARTCAGRATRSERTRPHRRAEPDRLTRPIERGLRADVDPSAVRVELDLALDRDRRIREVPNHP